MPRTSNEVNNANQEPELCLVSVNAMVIVVNLISSRKLKLQHFESMLIILHRFLMMQLPTPWKPFRFSLDQLYDVAPMNLVTPMTDMMTEAGLINKFQCTGGKGNKNTYYLLPQFIENTVWVSITKTVPRKKLKKVINTVDG